MILLNHQNRGGCAVCRLDEVGLCSSHAGRSQVRIIYSTIVIPELVGTRVL